MFLKSLEIQGFKSFPDKTKLDFELGITAVVGPNGSGKSNIADAVRWVMGEQSAKSLRGGRMEDVIFGGTQKRRPVGFAQVSITIDNSDHLLDVEAPEVTITRKYYRSGESEYRINKNTVRLRDIHELLMDTGLGRDGYSIIGQGKIAEIVSAKSGERREIFEEAAGISKFRYRKAQAEHRLELAQENLLRLKDILTEIEERLAPLKVQSEKAKKFVALSNEKRELEVSLFVQNLGGIREDLRDQENKIMICRAGYDELDESLQAMEEELGGVYERMNESTVRTEKLRQEKTELEEEIGRRESQAAVFENDIFHKNENIARLRGELAMSNDTSGEFVREITGKREEIGRLDGEIEKIEAVCAGVEEEIAHLQEQTTGQDARLLQLNRELNEITRKISDATVEQLTASSSVTEMESRQSLVAVNLRDRTKQVEDLDAELKSTEDFCTQLAEQIGEEENRLNGFRFKLDNRKGKLSEVESRISGVNGKIQAASQRAKVLSDMEKNMEDFSRSVKTVMRMAGERRLNGVHGPVSQLIRVPSKYALAIETALSAGIQNIVVDSEQVAKQAIQALKEQRAGRATFLPISSVKGNSIQTRSFEDFPGYIGLAADLVTYQEQYGGIMRSLLGRIVLCETLDDAIALARREGYKFRIVTLDGQLVNAGGSLTGGSNVRSAGILSRREEIAGLKGQIESLEAEKKEITGEWEKLSAQISSLEAECLNWESSLRVVREDKMKADLQIKSLEDNVQEGRRQLAALEAESGETERKITENRQRAEAAKAEYDMLLVRREEAEGQAQALGSGQEELNRRREELNGKLSQSRMELLALQKDRASLEQIVMDLESRRTRQEGRSTTIEGEIAAIEGEIGRIRLNIEDTKRMNVELSDRCGRIDGEILQLQEDRQNLEQETAQARKREKEWMGKKEDLSRELTRLEERKNSHQLEYDQIIAKLWDEYELTMSEAREVATDLEDPSGAKIRLGEIKGKIRALGSVNVDAIEEYEEVSQRHEFLNVQCRDVEKSRDELLKLIHELTKTMREIFTENFHQINRNFIRIFKELFGGGDARLELTEGEDVLESGINIYVQPPGKIIKNLTALSGGEQSFVAIAIYFAILRVRPAPFCLLDEIEAALDDVNVSRYAAYLRRMTDNTQFIAISHRRGTMEEADALYGVTMQEEGISKLLQLKVSEVESKLGLRAEGGQ